MRFSTTGRAAMGIGDGTVSVDNQRTPDADPSGEADWIDDQSIGYRCRGADGVYRLRRWTGAGASTALDGQTATTFRGGGGIWAAYIAGQGIRTSTGISGLEAARLCDVSAQGEIVICPDHQRGRDLRIIGRTQEWWIGTEALGDDATAGPNVRLRDGVLCYQAGGSWHLERLGAGPIAFMPRTTPINYAVPVTVAGAVYLLEREAYRLTLRKADSGQGWIIASGDQLWGPDAVAESGGVRIGWANNPSETPGSLVAFHQAIDAATMVLDPVVTDPRVPPSAPIVTFPGYRPTPQASYGRRGYSGPYFATDLRTGNFSTPGNCEMVVNGTVLGGNQMVDRPVFVSLASTGNDPAKMLGFLAGANDNSLSNAGILGCWHWAPAKQMIRYYDASPTPSDFINACEREAIVQVQCYPRDGEGTSAFMSRCVESVDRVLASGRKAGIARGFNTKYGGLERVLAVQDPLCAMVRARSGVILDAWFSHGRWYAGVESGAAYCAELLAWEAILGGLFTGLP